MEIVFVVYADLKSGHSEIINDNNMITTILFNNIQKIFFFL